MEVVNQVLATLWDICAFVGIVCMAAALFIFVRYRLHKKKNKSKGEEYDDLTKQVNASFEATTKLMIGVIENAPNMMRLKKIYYETVLKLGNAAGNSHQYANYLRAVQKVVERSRELNLEYYATHGETIPDSEDWDIKEVVKHILTPDQFKASLDKRREEQATK